MKKVSYILLVSILFISNFSFASVFKSNETGGGAWENAATWNSIVGGVPMAGDTIYISVGDVVTIESQVDYFKNDNTLPAMFLVIYGTLDFNTSSKKLFLPCGSKVSIKAGGLLTSSSHGGGSSSKIEICGNTAWKAGDGDKPGPLDITDPLPIKLLSFDAKSNNNSVNLTWVTSSEINNDYFTIDRSVDTKIWEEITMINGSGNSNRTISYSATDDSPLDGVAYYRLKQTDFNGKFEYFKVVSVTLDSEDTDFTVTIFPNPVTSGDFITLELSTSISTNILVVLTDVNGNNFYSQYFNGGKSIRIPINDNIPKGLYAVSLMVDNQTYRKKLIIH